VPLVALRRWEASTWGRSVDPVASSGRDRQTRSRARSKSAQVVITTPGTGVQLSRRDGRTVRIAVQQPGGGLLALGLDGVPLLEERITSRWSSSAEDALGRGGTISMDGRIHLSMNAAQPSRSVSPRRLEMPKRARSGQPAPGEAHRERDLLGKGGRNWRDGVYGDLAKDGLPALRTSAIGVLDVRLRRPSPV